MGAGSSYKYAAIRDDLRTKYNLPEIKDRTSLENYLFTIVAREPGIQAYNSATGEFAELCWVYLESQDILVGGDPVYFAWQNRNRNEPAANDLNFLYAPTGTGIMP
jgi:hypothetical protein